VAFGFFAFLAFLVFVVSSAFGAAKTAVAPISNDRPSIKVISFFIEVSLGLVEVYCSTSVISLQSQMNLTLRRY